MSVTNLNCAADADGDVTTKGKLFVVALTANGDDIKSKLGSADILCYCCSGFFKNHINIIY